MCALAEQWRPLAIGMTGVMMNTCTMAVCARRSRLASEQTMLLKSIVEPYLKRRILYVGDGRGLAQCVAINIRYETGRCGRHLADDDNSSINSADRRAEGNRTVRSSLAMALVWRGVARWSTGTRGVARRPRQRVRWPETPTAQPKPHVAAIEMPGTAIANGVLRADDNTVRELDEALQVAEGSGDDYLAGLKSAAGVALSLGTP